MGLCFLLSLLMIFARPIHAYNILMLAPLGSWSEYHLAKTLANTLVGVGHQVTLVSGFQTNKNQHSPITEIFVESSIFENENIFELDMIQTLFYVEKSQKEICNKMYTNKDILNIWNNRNNFDAIIAYSAANEVITPFLIDYHGAYIGLCPMGIEAIQISRQGNRLQQSVTPSFMINSDENMNFLERVMNLVIDSIITTVYDYAILPQIQDMLKNYFPEMPPVIDLYSNYSLLMLNSHFAMDGPNPLLPNQVEIGTLTARTPQPLSKDLEEFVDGAKHGVIYFSLGSLAKSTDIPNEKMDMLVEAFRLLPQRVVWKFEGDHIENLPSNVITRKWLSQQDILGHRKTLVFISHCGLFGTQEAKYHGVPVLGVPIFLDQHRNAMRLAKKGYGLVLNWQEMTVESLIESINILIENSSYMERIQALSKILQDQKESPQERAVWWVEYAIKHKDDSHMQYAGKNLNVVQYHMIDVWTFLIAMMIVWIFLSYLCIKRCLRKIVGSQSKSEIMNFFELWVSKKMLYKSIR